jgi:aminopeptidase N
MNCLPEKGNEAMSNRGNIIFTVGYIAHSKEKTIEQHRQTSAVVPHDRTRDAPEKTAVDTLGRIG